MFWKRLLLVLITFIIAESKYVELELSEDNEEWLFLTRFCYLSANGKIKYHLEYNNEYGPYKLLLYYNTENQWEDVYNKDDKTCSEKLSEPYISEEQGQIINLDVYARHNAGNCSLQDDHTTVSCMLEREFTSSSQRWWYIALARCDDTVNIDKGEKKGMYANFELTLTNGESLFFRHFSADEFYILQVDLTFLICFALILAIAIISAVSLHQRKYFHTTYKLYLAALSLQIGYLFFITLAYGLYTSDGVDKYGLRTFARVLDIASYLIYILMLILMGKGFTITRGKISKSGAIKIAVFLVLYTIGYIILFIFEARFMDPGEVLYLYQSPPGYALLAMRILAWAWFCFAVFFTLKHFPEKKKFYIPFFVFFTVWFWSNPIMILVANFVIGPHIRATVVNAVLIFIKFVGYLLFLCLTLPCCVGSVFPYHIRTTQITVISADQYPHDEEDSEKSEKSQQKLVYGNSNVLANSTNNSQQTTDLNQGPAFHVSPRGAPNFVDLFLISHTNSDTVKKFRYNRVDELEGTPRPLGPHGGRGSLPGPLATLPPINAAFSSPRPAGLMTTGLTTPRQPVDTEIQTSRYAKFESDTSQDKEENKESMIGKSLDNNPFITTKQ